MSRAVASLRAAREEHPDSTSAHNDLAVSGIRLRVNAANVELANTSGWVIIEFVTAARESLAGRATAWVTGPTMGGETPAGQRPSSSWGTVDLAPGGGLTAGAG